MGSPWYFQIGFDPFKPIQLKVSRLTNANARTGWVRVCLWGLIGLACAMQAYEIPNRGIDPDELEHLHAAYCVWRGQVPYRDFFEHHGPALYYLVAPLLALRGPDLSALWLGRLMMWCFSLATLGLTGRLARRCGGERAGLLAMALLAWTTIFHAKAIEVRPDGPATLLIMLAVVPFTYATGGGSWRRFLYVGLLVGLATLFTHKSVVPGAGIGLAACVARLLTRAPASESAGKTLARVIVPMAAGIALNWGIAALLFAMAGAARDFWYSTWYQLWLWPVRSGRWEHLRPTLAGDFTVWVAAAIEICAVLKGFRAPETWKEQRGVAALIAAVCIVSLTVVKATYAQYYFLWMPFMAVLAAQQLVLPIERARERRALAALIIAGEVLILVGVPFWRRASLVGFQWGFSHLASQITGSLPLLVALAAAAFVVAVMARRGKIEPAMLLVAALGMSYGARRNVETARWSNAEQVAAIESVNRHVPPDGRILDGFTGYGALRPHAWYYWWINQYSLALVSPYDREVGLLKVLVASPPAAVLVDENFERLPRQVRDWIEARYEPSDPAVLWLPREPPNRSHE